MLVADLGSQHDLMLAVHGFRFNSLSVELGLFSVKPLALMELSWNPYTWRP